MVALSVVLVCLMTVTSEAQEKLEKGEAKSIAEEAFVYGFPMVMNYGVMYETYIDKSSSQYKCPLNQLYNTARVFTPKGSARRGHRVRPGCAGTRPGFRGCHMPPGSGRAAAR